MKELNKNSVILQDHLNGRLRWIRFSNPFSVIQTDRIDEVKNCLEKIQQAIDAGAYAAGYIAYEAASGMNEKLESCLLEDYPLIWFGLYNTFSEFNIDDIEEDAIQLRTWEPNISLERYNHDISSIKSHIKSGDTYQVNYTFRLRNQFTGNPLSFAKKLFKAQSSEYCAYINTGEIHICSASPELFFNYDSGKILSKPMKGTVKRGPTNDIDEQRGRWLGSSIKNRAENVMIVDMIRNDLGEIADPGTVKVEKLFEVERYPTVFQMTSTVSARSALPPVKILEKIFPCASITGAPKVRTMQIIRDLEQEPRGIYTGSIGYFSPDNKAQLNVAIRTVVINEKSTKTEYGVGGGIVWDSVAGDEYNECCLKAEILTYKEPEFNLLETLIWTPSSGFGFLDQHINRARNSAHYFNFHLNRVEFINKINEAVEGQIDKLRVKVEVSRSGKISATAAKYTSLIGGHVKLAFAEQEPANASRFIYHKTTNRTWYNHFMEMHPDCCDVLIANRDGFLTESCRANLVIKHNGRLYTPAIESGLLNGVFREKLLKERVIEETLISIEMLKAAESFYLVNSVRGWMELETGKDSLQWTIRSEKGFDFLPEDEYFSLENDKSVIC